jgi:hypothetical protein
MHYKQHYAHDQGNVNETARYVKREQPKKPQNNQNRGEHREHIVSSILYPVVTFRALFSNSTAHQL